MKIIDFNFSSRLIFSFEFFGLGIIYQNKVPQIGINETKWLLQIDAIFIRFWIQRTKQ